MNGKILHRENQPRAASRLHKTIVSLLAITVIGFAIWAVVSVAGDGSSGHRMRGGGPLQAMASHLDLTDDQQAQVREIIGATMQEGKVLNQQMRGMREQIMTSVRENGYDEDQVRLIAENNMPLLVDMAVLRIRAMGEIYEILTPEQQAEADKFIEQGGPGRWGRHAGHRGGGGQHNFSRGSL